MIKYNTILNKNNFQNDVLIIESYNNIYRSTKLQLEDFYVLQYNTKQFAL